LLAELLKEKPVTWAGRTRAALTTEGVYPRTESGSLRTWVGVGGSAQSVVRAARYGLPLTLAIIGGVPVRFASLVDLYRRSLGQYHHSLTTPVAVHSPGHVAGTDAEAREELWPHYRAIMARIGHERGWPPMTREQFDEAAGPNGALFVGSPETVATKIAMVAKALGLARFNLKYSAGTLPHEKLLTSIELYGTKVAPLVHQQLA
jgi:alkanesulfonate monooxygenase SsuD/methylene tetrahydromethanopterin reductase-like flavin-dependent oxidoreductase (luciferase family)